jgi:L-lysine exporter family protein LysE/ArgO
VSSSAALAVLAGLGLGLSLIVAIGAQNAFVLRQGLRLEHVGAVVAVCAASDAVLIAAGVLGAGAVLLAHPDLLTAVCFLGAVFLLTYGAMAVRRALRPTDSLAADASGARAGLAATLATCLALTWLNPHVYLDTLLLLGSIAAHHGPSGKWWFAVGASLGSILWFTGLGYGARLAAPLLSRPRAWQVLDVLIGLTMLTIAYQLARG